jgi:N-acetylneuraminate synthase
MIPKNFSRNVSTWFKNLDMSRCPSQKTLIIAEAGVNHNGSIDRARALIDVAASAGADAVKFQTFKATEVISRHAPKADYQKLTTSASESQLEMVQRLELSEADHRTLINHCNTNKIEFLSTPFDLPSLRLLTDRFQLSTIKMPSGEGSRNSPGSSRFRLYRRSRCQAWN